LNHGPVSLPIGEYREIFRISGSESSKINNLDADFSTIAGKGFSLPSILAGNWQGRARQERHRRQRDLFLICSHMGFRPIDATFILPGSVYLALAVGPAQPVMMAADPRWNNAAKRASEQTAMQSDEVQQTGPSARPGSRHRR
jgi:hypothetical protein